MPIRHDVTVRAISEESFREIDRLVMQLARAVHKDLGRFYNERVYRNELAWRCRDSGVGDVRTEVPIEAVHAEFRKSYYADLILDAAVLYELKAVTAIAAPHRMQTINYLQLLGMGRGRLVNFRPPALKDEFVSTTLTPEARHEIAIDEIDWRSDDAADWLKETLCALLADWGAFLDLALYYDALTFFRGGPEKVIQDVPVACGSHALGTQKVRLLNPGTAFKLTAIPHDTTFYGPHLMRFLGHTPLESILWVNFDHHRVVFRRISH